MSQTDSHNFKVWLSTIAPYILAVAVAFFVFELYLLVNSIPADYQIYQYAMALIPSRGSFWPMFWLASELVGEVGLIFRFSGACFFMVFAWLLFRKKEALITHLRRGVFLEATHYLFFTPFIVYLFLRPNASIVSFEAAFSYMLQLLIILPAFMMLYAKLGKSSIDNPQTFKWIAIATTSFIFALWTKHFIFNLYALPINFQDPVLTVGFLNSTLTMLVAALIWLWAFLPLIRGKSANFSTKKAGIGLVLLGLYFVIYIFVSLFNAGFQSYLMLTELWAISIPIIGLGMLKSMSND